MLRTIVLSAILLSCFGASVISQEAPSDSAKTTKSYDSYNELFDDFLAKREVLVTKMDRLRERENVKPEEIKAVEDDMKALDVSYADALDAYIQGHATAKDLMSARFELTVTLSRMEDKLDQAVLAADDFIKNHADSEPIGDVYFMRGQTLFRIEGREKEALAALDLFIEKFPDRQDTDAARGMRIRALLFMDRVAEARTALSMLIKTDRVKKDKDAKEYLQGQLDNLGWVDRELPAFTAPDLESKLRKSADYAGKPLLLFIWDSNSSACIGELPFVQEAFKRYSEKMNFLSVSVNESKPALEQWFDRNPEALKFPTIWFDRDTENTLVKKLDVSFIPFLVLVDAAGKIYRYDVRSDDMLRYAAILTGE